MISGVGTAWAADTWVKTAPSSLQTGDVVVIVDQTSGKAMSNNNGTSSAPSATAVTLNGDKTEITSEVASTLQWEVTVNDGSYQFGVANSSNYLYCTQTNNGVRVGTNANNAFTVYDNDGVDFLVNTATTRYVGVYNGQDWRCYTSINANIKNSVTAFYKKAPAGPVDLTSFAFATTSPSVTLSKNGDNYEAEYKQTVTVDPTDYNGDITYTIENSTFDTNDVIIDDNTGEIAISTTNNVGGTIVVKASGEATAAYNKPADATYTLTVNAAPVGVGTPTFSLATGAYYYGTTVEIEAVNSTLITYTTDGTTPTMESTTYSDPVAITKTMTLKAKAWDDGLNESEIASIDYTLKAPEAPTFSVEGGEVVQGSTITLTPGEGGSVVVYTTDGSTPTIDSDIYIDPIKINAAMTIKAATVDDGDNLSAIASYDFTVKKAVIYEKVTDAESLADGDQVLVVCESKEMAMGAQAATYRTNVNVEITEYSIINPSSDIEVVTLESVEGGWLLKAEDGYLVSSSAKSLKTTANAEDASIVSIDIDDNGDAILAFGNNGYLKYNSSSPRFTTYASGQTSIQLYRLQENLEEATITITPSENFTLNNGETKVLTVTASNGEVITATSSDEEVATVKKTGTNEYTVTAVSGTAEGTDVTITFSTEKTATHKAGKATITATVKDARVELDLSFAETSVEVNVGEDVAAPTLNGNVGGGAVTFASENESIATVNATTGVVTGVAEGVTTITATVAEVTGYKGGTATFEVTVIDPNKKGTKNNPYTVAEALENTPSSGNSETVYVTGAVTGFYDDVEDVTKERYHRYYISDEGENNQLLVYNGKGLDNEAFDSADDLMIGDVVKIVGQLTTYNGTKEFAKDNYIVSLTRKADPELSFAETEFEVLTGASFDAPVLNNPHELTVTYASDNAEVATVDASTGAVTILGVEGTAVITASFAGNETYRAGEASYTISVGKYDAQLVIAQTEVSLNGGMEKAMTEFYTTESDGAVTYESTDETIAKVENGVLKTLKVGTTTITVNVAASTNYQTASGSFELTVTALPDVAPAGPVGRFVKVTATEDIVDGQYLIVNETAGVAFDGSLETLDAADDVTRVTISNGVIDATDKIIAKAFTIDVTNGTLKSASGYYIGVSSNNNGLKQTEDAETYTHSFEIDENDDAVITAIFDESTMSLRYNKASNQNRFRYYKNAGQEAIQLYRYEAGSAESFDIAISEAKWRTLVASVNVKFPAEVKAYIVTAKTSEKAQLNKVSAVKAGVPVLLNAEPGNYTLTVVTDEECANTEANLLQVSEQNTCENVYVLANKSNGVGFYQWTGGWMGAGRVYLPVSPEVGARGFLAFDEDGETTGISTIQNAEQGTKEIYNLNGQRVNQPAKGLYIVNGKKVFIK